MKLTRALAALPALALSASLVACGDDGSSTSASADCSVTKGVVVVSPAKGDTYKIGETITIVYGSDIAAGGFIFQYRVNEDAKGVDLSEGEGSLGPEKPDGKTCYEQKFELKADLVEPSKEAVIRVIPYYDQGKGSNSAAFTVTK